MKSMKNQITKRVDITTHNVSSPHSLSIIAAAYNPATDRSYYEVEYLALDGSVASKLIPRELFETPSKAALDLKSSNAQLNNGVAEVKAAIAAIANQKPPYFTLTGRTGWNGDSFVFPKKTFGPAAKELRYDMNLAQLDPALGAKMGSLEGWRDGLLLPCRKSDYLILAASLAAASALLEIIGEEEGACFHLHGGGSNGGKNKTSSTSGKSVTTRVAISAVGRSKKTDLFSYDISPRAMEEFCFCHNNMVLGLDEEGRAVEGAVQGRIRPAQLPYVIASGRGTVRSTKATRDSTLQNHTWSLYAMSNGEYPLGQRQGERAEGAQLRQIGIPVPPGSKGGIFNLLEGPQKQLVTEARKLMAQTEQTIEDNHGIAFVEFVKALVARDRKELSLKTQEQINSFVQRVKAEADPWEGRFARKFGVIYAAACLMSDLNIGPWTRKRARRAISNLYRVARRALVSVPELTDRVLKELAAALREGKFPEVVKGRKHCGAPGSWGMIRKLKGERHVLLTRNRFNRVVTPSASVGSVLRQLARTGVLVRGTDGKLTKQIMVNEKRRRYVCLKKSALLKGN